MATQTPPPYSAFLAPKFWPTWLGIACLCLIAWLPFRIRTIIGSALGRATFLLAKERRYITEVNIRLCFPELSHAEQDALVLQSFVENGIGLIETSTGWVRPAKQFGHMLKFVGVEALSEALEEGRGILLLGAHYSTLDFGAILLSLHFPFAVTYRAHKNPVFDSFMLRGRINNCSEVFDRKDIRGAFRHLKQGKILWYAPDQDYGPEQSVYAPFFNRRAATITATSRFARVNKSPIFMVSQKRIDSEKRYILEFTAIPSEYPSGDDVQDATLINYHIEQLIRKAPAQYLWMHKRFKTQPGGKPESPYIFIRTRNRKLSSEQFKELSKQASELTGDISGWQLESGLQLWNFPQLASGLRKHKHPACRLDKLSKQLRSIAIETITVDNIFRFPHLNSSGATVFIPDGEALSKGTIVAPAIAAHLLHALHQHGFSFIELQAHNLISKQDTLAILNPLGLRHYPGSTALLYRAEDFKAFVRLFDYSEESLSEFLGAYLALSPHYERAALKECLSPARQFSS